MRIAVNTRFLLSGQLEGNGWYIHETWKRIVQQHPEHEFFFLFDRPFEQDFIYGPNVTPVVVAPAARHPVLWKWWFDFRIPRVLKKIKADLFFSPDGFCSLRTKVPQITVIHDLAFLRVKNGQYASHERYYKKNTPLYINKSKHIIAVSEFTKQDIIAQYNTPAQKITVIPNAARSIFRIHTWDEKQAVKERYAGGKEFFLYTGSIHPRKNLLNLLKAFSIFKKWQHSEMKLVLAGRAAWKSESFIKSLDTYKYRNDLVLTGYLPDEELARLTASAYAMVYPSVFEGFGLPVVEAMQSGVPVVTSNTSALPETGGNAALYANPDMVDEIAGQMMLLYKDEALRARQVALGLEQAARYSWDESARKIWEVIKG
jgi:glycosyltransferase involved in cell wall biosynthesis